MCMCKRAMQAKAVTVVFVGSHRTHPHVHASGGMHVVLEQPDLYTSSFERASNTAPIFVVLCWRQAGWAGSRSSSVSSLLLPYLTWYLTSAYE